MQDRVKEILESLHAEWGLGELYAWRTGLDLMIQRRKAGKPYTIEIKIGTRSSIDVEEYLRQERGAWVSPTYGEVMDQVLLLSDEDQDRLLRELDDYIKLEEEKWATFKQKIKPEPFYSVMNFEGVARGT